MGNPSQPDIIICGPGNGGRDQDNLLNFSCQRSGDVQLGDVPQFTATTESLDVVTKPTVLNIAFYFEFSIMILIIF